jgi:hypothetical protein
MSLCEPGRGVVHQAICDGCDKVSLKHGRGISHVVDDVYRPSLGYDTNA